MTKVGGGRKGRFGQRKRNSLETRYELAWCTCLQVGVKARKRGCRVRNASPRSWSVPRLLEPLRSSSRGAMWSHLQVRRGTGGGWSGWLAEVWVTESQSLPEDSRSGTGEKLVLRNT